MSLLIAELEGLLDFNSDKENIPAAINQPHESLAEFDSYSEQLQIQSNELQESNNVESENDIAAENEESAASEDIKQCLKESNNQEDRTLDLEDSEMLENNAF